MFSFVNKKSVEDLPQPLPLLVDLHSHLIPEVDDGSRNIVESLGLISVLKKFGYKKLIITPHVMFDSFKNSIESILDGLLHLQEELLMMDIQIEVEAAAEYYLDEGFIDLLKSKEILPIGKNYLLFETSYTHKPFNLEDIIYEIKLAGYIPLLAHPERYRYIKNKKEEYEILKSLGVMFQVNLNSFNGYYGKVAKENAHFLSEHGMIDFLGSDTHNLKQLKNLATVFESDEYKKIYLHNAIKNNELL